MSRLVPRLLRKAQQRDLPPLVNPAISRDFVHVDDVCGAFYSILENSSNLTPGQVYNIGAGRRVTLEELVLAVRTTFGIEQAPVWGSMPDRRWDHRDWYSNPAKAAADLDWRAQIGLVDGLKSTMSWIVNNPDVVAEGERHAVTAVKP
jgi:dolichol-phosphate mannosyltransferase